MVCIEFNNIVAHVLGDHSPLQWQGNGPIASTDDEIPVDSVERPSRDRCNRSGGGLTEIETRSALSYKGRLSWEGAGSSEGAGLPARWQRTASMR
jgi:hypothetical protein